MDTNEKHISKFLQEYNLRAEKFSKEEKKHSQTPDFRVFLKNEMVFYCEIKTVSKDTYLDQQFENAPAGKIVGGLRNDPIYNNLTKKIYEAAKQFDAVNPKLEFPNVLVLVNQNDLCGFDDLHSCLTGNFTDKNDNEHPIFRQFSEGRIIENKNRINLHIWISDDRVHWLFNEINDQHHKNLCAYFGQQPIKKGKRLVRQVKACGI